MKKTIALLLLLSFTLSLAGCSCEHEWLDATCATPKTCAQCEEIEGAPLGHSWTAASCNSPKTCENCGETEGDTLPHTFADATCETPKTCENCGITEGDTLQHQWEDATYSVPMTCSICGATEGEALLRTDLGMDHDTLALAISQMTQLLGYDLMFLGVDEYGWPVFDVVTITSEESTGVNITFEPTMDGTLVYAIAIYTEDVTNLEASALLGVIATTTLLGLEENFDTDLLTQTLAGTPTMMDGTALYSMESYGLVAEMQASEESILFWIYPAG